MRIVHVFNMANDAYNIVKYMRAVGMEADLILNKQDFGMAFPQWEDGVFPRKANPCAVDSNALDTLKSLPSWIKVWDQNRIGMGVLASSARRNNLFRVLEGLLSLMRP